MFRIEIDGRAATVEAMWSGGGFGHFTAMQVRDRKARGVDLHLARLEEGNRALFGVGWTAIASEDWSDTRWPTTSAMPR